MTAPCRELHGIRIIIGAQISGQVIGIVNRQKQKASSPWSRLTNPVKRLPCQALL